MLRASWILYTAHLRRTLFSKRALLCLLLCAAPLLPAGVIVTFAPDWNDGPPAVFLLWSLQIQLAMPLVSLLLGSAVVAEEIEDRTVTYLFTRPIPRAALLLGRWAAALTVALLLLCAGAWALVAVLDSGASTLGPALAVDGARRMRLLQTIVLGTTSYTLVFAVLGAIFKHPVIIGLGYTFAIEGFFANLPGSSQGITIQYWLKSFLMSEDPLVQEHLQALPLIGMASPEQALARLILIMVIAAALGTWTVTRKQYLLSA